MKKLINTKYPQNVIIVDDAYVNGSRIVCSAGNDDFDVWESCWKIEDFQPSEDLEAAVEGIIVGFPSRNDIKMQADEFSKATANFKDGDKVKVIIVKEDEK